MHKKSRIFPFILMSIVILGSFFLFSSLIFPEEAPKDWAASSPPEAPENQNNEKEADPAITLPPDQQANPNDRNNSEEEGTKISPSHSQAEKTEAKWNELLPEKLSFLQTPLPGAGITTRDSQLPGAPRAYRHGVHEGLDFYSGYCGIQVNNGDPVFAAGPGIIYRIDHDYSEPSVEEREAMLQACKEKGVTPEIILDKLRGRQVWITHSYGLVTRYAHLSKVAEHLQEGDPVEAGDYLGNVGNSGTSEGARGESANSHLHLEIWLENSYLGEGLTPQEIRSLWETLLQKDG